MRHRSAEKFFLYFTCLCIAFTASFICYSQDKFKFDSFTTEDGLSSNVIYAIFQDSKGYLWIGTHDGLNRYDGYTFKKFRNDPLDTNSIVGNKINKIFEDSRGLIWLVTDVGVCTYNLASGKFKRILESFSEVFPINQSELLVRADHTYYLFDINTRKLLKLDKPVSKTGYSYQPAFQSVMAHNGVIYVLQNQVIGDDSKLWKFDRKEKKFIEYCTIIFPGEINPRSLDWVFIDSRDRIWFSTMHSLLVYDKELGDGETILTKLIVTKKEKIAVRQIIEDKSGNIWIGSIGGLFFYDHKTGKLTEHFNGATDFSINSNIINAIQEDKTGIIWIGTFNGLNKYNNSANRFSHFTANGEDPILADNSVLGIFPGLGNQLYIHYLFDILSFSIFDFQLNSISHYPVSSGSLKDQVRHIGLKNPEAISDSSLDRQAVPLEKYFFDREVGPGSLIADDKQNLWHNRHSALVFIKTGELLDFGFYIFDLYINRDELWFATDKGLICWHLPTRQTTGYTFNPRDRNSISSNIITCLIMEDNGNMWVGTKEAGLNYFDREKKIFKRYTEDAGLSSNSIYSMVKDNAGRIWLGTGKGLSCFDPKTRSFKNFYRSDGIINSEYNRNSAYKLPGGDILMGGMSGIDHFNPEIVNAFNIPPVVQITDFKIYNKSIYSAGNFSLKHDQNYVSIEFATLDFKDPAANRFMYKMEGVDKDWVRTEGQHFASYPTLAPGRYRFLVKGANSNEIWNEEPSVIEFSIRTPWWRSWWFYTSLALLAAIILYKIYRYRINQVRKIYSMRHEISQDLHDQVGATLTSISFLSEVGKKQTLPDIPANNTLNKIGEYSREMIGEMNDIVWAINPANDRFDKIVDRMQNYVSPLLAAKKIRLDFDADPALQQLNLSERQRKNLYLIFKEAINNAAKYSACTNVIVKLYKKHNNINLDITDDGIGFTAKEQENGNGLINIKLRAEAIKATILIDSFPGKGTKIKLSLPITRIAYS